MPLSNSSTGKWYSLILHSANFELSSGIHWYSLPWVHSAHFPLHSALHIHWYELQQVNGSHLYCTVPLIPAVFTYTLIRVPQVNGTHLYCTVPFPSRLYIYTDTSSTGKWYSLILHSAPSQPSLHIHWYEFTPSMHGPSRILARWTCTVIYVHGYNETSSSGQTILTYIGTLPFPSHLEILAETSAAW